MIRMTIRLDIVRSSVRQRFFDRSVGVLLRRARFRRGGLFRRLCRARADDHSRHLGVWDEHDGLHLRELIAVVGRQAPCEFF